MFVTPVLIVIVVTLILHWYWNRKKRFQLFEELGIPGPKPRSVTFGNMLDMHNKGLTATLADWRETYGQTFGYFEGPRPVIVTSDVNVLEQVFIKNFTNFTSRKPMPIADTPTDKYIHLLNARGARWRRLRAVVSPTFSGRRMKEMMTLMHGATAGLMDVLEQHCSQGEDFDIHFDCQRLSLAVIMACGFGIDVNIFKEPENIFLLHARKMLEVFHDNAPFSRLTVLIPAAIAFPDIAYPWGIIREYLTTPRTWLFKTAAAVLKERTETKSDRIDFIKLLLDARDRETLTSALSSVNGLIDPPSDHATPGSTKETDPGEQKQSVKGLTQEEMIGQCLVILLAAYETTSSTLGFLLYRLAIHPHIQRRLQSDIDASFPPGGPEPDYDNIQLLPYLNMVISETLRLYPFPIVMTRQAEETCEVGGLHIPKGVYVQADAEAVHHDPRHWGPEDPNHFIPERFSAERKSCRHPLAWMPFGLGPRACIGQRFALQEMRLVVVTVLRKYNIERCPRTNIPLQVNKYGTGSPAKGVFVKVTERIRAKDVTEQ